MQRSARIPNQTRLIKRSRARAYTSRRQITLPAGYNFHSVPVTQVEPLS